MRWLLSPAAAAVLLIVTTGCTGTLRRRELVPGSDGGAPPRDSSPPPRDAAPGPDAGAAGTDGGSAGTDGGPTDPCASVTCGANARCDAASARCVCLDGFVDMGGACVAVPPGDPAGRTEADVCAHWRDGHVENSARPWTAGATECDLGTVPREALDDTVRRINMFRWLVGLDPVTDDAALDAREQACAVMMNVNGTLSHTPPPSWRCYTADGAAAAGSSNLALGTGTPGDAIDLFMDDSGVASLGHRRWVVNGPLNPVGIGFAGNATCLGVFGMSGGSTRDWTAYPNPGPAPSGTAGAKWSFHSNRWDLSGASVAVTRAADGGMLAVTVDHLPDGFGPNTVAWTPSGWTPTVGQRYRVAVSGIAPGTVTYEVLIVGC